MSNFTPTKPVNHSPRRGKAVARPVADLVTKLLDPVIERRAGMTMDLVCAWPEIVGERHAKFSRPEKLNWPRRAHDDDPFEPAVLVLACEQIHVLYLQHDTDALVRRINGYFGFTAIHRIKIVQKPLSKPKETGRKEKPATPSLTGEAQRRLASLLEHIEDEALRQVLKRMGQGVFSARSSDI
ncbi:MAG: DciA family protein [Pseudomonadota bacterium]